jgi:predicted PurR-regulated permease PerM
LIAAIEDKVGGYIRAQVILDLSIGSAALIAYLLIGLPYTLVLAIFAGLMETVPIFGPILGAIPAVFVALTVDPSKVIWVLGATVIIQTMENYLLVPRVVRSSVGVNPIVTLLSLAAFGSLLGLPGALLAVPLAAIFQVLLTRFVLSMDLNEEQAPAGRDQASLIRYEAKDLIQDVRKQLVKKENLADEDSDEVENTIESIANEIDLLLAEAEGAQVPE